MPAGISTELEEFQQKLVENGTYALIVKYLNDSTEIHYNTMLQAVKSSKSSSTLSGIRILVSAADGRVIVDTGKPDTNNTHAKAVLKEVNENHQSRLAILVCLLGPSGVGFESKFSSSTGRNELYLAYRVGKSVNDAIGVVRVSMT